MKMRTDILTNNDFDPNRELPVLLAGLPQEGSSLTVVINQQTGQVSILDKEDPSVGLTGLEGSVELDGELVPLAAFSLQSVRTTRADDLQVHELAWQSPQYAVGWNWTIVQRDRSVSIMASLENQGSQPVAIGRWNIVEVVPGRGGLALGQGGGLIRHFRWNTWNMGVEALTGVRSQYSSDNILHLYDPAAGQVLFSGFLTLSRMRASHQLEYNAAQGVTSYAAACLFGTYLLQPGQTFRSELLQIGFHHDPYAVLEQWADQVRLIYQPEIATLPPVGWCGGSWASSRSDQDRRWEQYALENARAIRRRLKGFDVQYLWTSQSNLKDYIPGNWLQVNQKEIPSGMPGFFSQMAELGFRPGLWVSPFWFYGEAEGMLAEHHENLLRDDIGEPICREEVWGWRYDDDLPWYHMHRYFLDGTHPRSIAYIRKLFAYYREIGVRYYMLDFLGIVDRSVLFDPNRTPHQAGYAILREIRSAAGPDTHIQTAVASSPGFSGTISAARIGRDFGEGRPLEGGSLSDWRNATHVLHDQHYANTKYFLQNIAANYFTHQKLYMNDLNLMTVDKPYPLDHARIVATLFGLNGGSPLMLGDDFLRLDEERLRLIKLCLPRTCESARPVDLFERVQPDDYCRLLKLEIRTDCESYLLVGAFNMDDQAYDLTLDFTQLGLDAHEKYVVYDFWNEAYCGIFRQSYPVSIPPQNCKLYRIARARPYPWLLSTDLHIQQGHVEISSLQWDESTRCLTIQAKRPAGESGSLFLLMPRQYQLVNPDQVSLIKELLDFNVIIRVPVRFTNDTMDFAFTFEDWKLGMLAPRGLIPYATYEEWQAYMKKHYDIVSTRVFE
jgi:hypothetical protein